MAYRVTWVLGSFADREDKERLRVYHDALVDFLYQFDVLYLRDHPMTPLLYGSGVFYMSEPQVKTYNPAFGGVVESQQEDWLDIPNVLAKRYGDCEDLACYRAAELTVRYNIPATPFSTYREYNNFTLYHVLVRLPDGTVEDPSKILGMKTEYAGYLERYLG